MLFCRANVSVILALVLRANVQTINGSKQIFGAECCNASSTCSKEAVSIFKGVAAEL